MAAIRNAAVFPVPVRACPATVAAREGERQGLRLNGSATFESGLPHPLEKRRLESHFFEPGVGKDAGRAGRIGLVGPLAITVQLVSNGMYTPLVNGRRPE